MAIYQLDKVPETPKKPHGLLALMLSNMAGAHTPTGYNRINHVSPWFTENSIGVPWPHPSLTMGAPALYLTPEGQLIDPFWCGDPVIRGIWPDTGPDSARPVSEQGARCGSRVRCRVQWQRRVYTGCRTGSGRHARTTGRRTSAYTGCLKRLSTAIMTHLALITSIPCSRLRLRPRLSGYGHYCHYTYVLLIVNNGHNLTVGALNGR